MCLPVSSAPARAAASVSLGSLFLLAASLRLAAAAPGLASDAPVGLTATGGKGQATLTWDDIPLGPPPPGGSFFTGYYNLYRGTKPGSATFYARAGSRHDVSSNKVTYTDTHVSPGSTYYYQVTSVTSYTVSFPHFPTKVQTTESAKSTEVKAVLKPSAKCPPQSPLRQGRRRSP